MNFYDAFSLILGCIFKTTMSSMDKTLQNITDLQSQIDDLVEQTKLDEQDYIDLCNSMKNLFNEYKPNGVITKSDLDHVVMEKNWEIEMLKRHISSDPQRIAREKTEEAYELKKDNERLKKEITLRRCQYIINRGKFLGMKCLKPCDGDKCNQHLNCKK
jgi:hypothetical protein